ncbi:hypothetical protein D3C84_1239790 [compost metagenome]
MLPSGCDITRTSTSAASWSIWRSRSSSRPEVFTSDDCTAAILALRAAILPDRLLIWVSVALRCSLTDACCVA